MGEIVNLSVGPRRGFRKAVPATAWYERGCALEAHDPDAAMTCYRRAVGGLPELADAHNNLGRLHHDRHELADAEGCYRLAICARASVPLYWFNLGVVLEDQGRHAEAIAAYERALALDPQLADAHYNLARQIERAARAVPGTDEVLLRRAIRHLQRYRDLARASG